MSVYLELCEILGISLNEFLAGEDIEVTNVEKKSEDTLIQISKDSSHKQRYLKKIIAVLLIAVGVFAITLGIMVPSIPDNNSAVFISTLSGSTASI